MRIGGTAFRLSTAVSATLMAAIGQTASASDKPSPPILLETGKRIHIVPVAAKVVSQREDASDQPRHISIEPGTLDAALKALAKQTSITLAYETALTAGLTTRGIAGAFRPIDALAELLRDTDLTYRSAGAATITLVNPRYVQLREPAPPTGIQLEELSVAAQAKDTKAGPSASRLPSAYAGGQVAQGARLGMLGNTDIAKSPFSVTSYTDKFIRDRQALTASEALALDPSVRATQSTGAPFDSFYIRGFPPQREHQWRSRLRRGLRDRSELPRLHGLRRTDRGSQRTVRRALGRFSQRRHRRRHQYRSETGRRGSDAYHPRLRLDRAGRRPVRSGPTLRREREWGIRVVGSLRGGNTPIDRQSETMGVGALALDYQGERFRASLYMLAQTDRFDAPLRPFLLQSGVRVPRAPDGRRNVSQPWEYSDIDDRSSLLHLEYDLTDQITLFGDVGGSQSGVERYFASAPTILNARGDTSTSPQFYSLGVERYTVDGGVRAGFDTGFIRHAFVVQASRYQEDADRRLMSARGSYRSNLYDPFGHPTSRRP